MINFRYVFGPLLAFYLGVSACSPSETEAVITYSDPYRLSHDECHDFLQSIESLYDEGQAGNPYATLCRLTAHNGRQHYDPLEDLYLLYRIEGIEPEGLDERIRALDRRLIATKIRNWHDLNDFLEPVEGRNWRGCLKYDPIAHELITRGRDPEIPHEFDDCLPR